MFLKIVTCLMIIVIGISCSPKNKFKHINSTSEALKISNIMTSNISDLDGYKENYIWIQNVKALSFNQFSSKKGNQILKVKIQDNKNNQIEGIFFEGDYNNSTTAMLAQEINIDLLIKVTTYKGKTSFIAKYIKNSDQENSRHLATEGK